MIPWTRMERRWRDALLGAMIPARGVLPSAAALELDGFWRLYQETAPPLLRVGLRVAVWTLTLLAPFYARRARLFPGLPPVEQDRVLQRAAGSSSYLVRQLAMTLKLLACFAYLRDPRVRAAVEQGGAHAP
jgi:hypothetical protein